jgi:hypothetical protein
MLLHAMGVGSGEVKILKGPLISWVNPAFCAGTALDSKSKR